MKTYYIDESYNNIVYNITEKMYTKILDIQNKEIIKAIEEYCEEHNIIPNLIDSDKLDLVLKLGIQALNERGWNK